MQLLPSYDQSPPIGAPFRFFLSAPLFGILAGMLILWSGDEVFVSRWTSAALAVTHLITVGFMLQVMLGALLQIGSSSGIVVVLAALSVLMASINIFGGFLVTRRMLAMFQKS